MFQDLYLLAAGIGTFLSGVSAWSSRRKIKRLETDTAYPRLARCLRECDELKVETKKLRAECRRLAESLREAIEHIHVLEGSL